MNALSYLAPHRFIRLMVADTKNISRDPVLLGAVLMAIIPAIALYFTRLKIDTAALSAFGLADFSAYLTPVILTLPAALVGWATGFLILEERDEGPLLALDITPLGKTGFVLHRATATFGVTLLITALATPFLLPGASVAVWVFIPVFVGLQAVMLAFALPAIARNKVEGLAITKILNILALGALLAVFPSPLRFIAGVIPGFWVGELAGLAPQPDLGEPILIILGLAAHLVIVWQLFRLLDRKVG